jgi:acyl carrier protein
MKKKIIDIIYAAIDDLNEQLPAGRKLEKTPETVLLGTGGTIDSVGFINLIVLLEEKCQDNFGVAVTLTEETAADDTFRNIASLERHISSLVGEQG